MIRRTHIILNSIAISSTLTCSALPLPNIQHSMNIQGFLGTGWKIERQISCSFSPHLKNAILVVAIEAPASTPEPQREDSNQFEGNRTILIVVKDNDKFKLIGRGDNVLRCSKCYGMLGPIEGGRPEISVQKGKIIIRENGGGRYTFDEKIIFEFNEKSQKFELILKIRNSLDRVTGDSSTDIWNCKTQTLSKEITKQILPSGKETKITSSSKLHECKIYLETYDFENSFD